MTIRRLVLDLLVPHDPGVVVYAERLSELDGVDGVTLDVLEEDADTRTLEVTLEGEALSLDAISRLIGELGGALHSVDQVSSGSRIVEAQIAPNDRT